MAGGGAEPSNFSIGARTLVDYNPSAPADPHRREHVLAATLDHIADEGVAYVPPTRS